MPATITAELGVPADILTGLTSGHYERFGGVVRDTQSKQIVAWLREVGSGNISHEIAAIMNIGAVASVLNLGISTMGFIVLNKKVNDLQKDMLRIQKTLVRIEQKIDVQFQSKLGAAIQLANEAMTVVGQPNKNSIAHQSLQQFGEVAHYYQELALSAAKAGAPECRSYFSAACLGYVGAARCYLGIGEVAAAEKRLGEAAKEARTMAVAYANMLLHGKPGLFLHPKVIPPVSLSRMQKMLRWGRPDDEDDVTFDRMRSDIFGFDALAMGTKRREWINTLPAAVWSAEFAIPRKKLSFIDEVSPEVWPHLAAAFAGIEAVIDDQQRVVAYHLEVKSLREHHINFREWSNLSVTDDAGQGIACVRIAEVK